MSFSWVPFYREVAQQVLKYENDQAALLKILHEMKTAELPTIPLEENQADGEMMPLTEIDPFTFLANIARVETPQGIKICAFLKKKWDLRSPLPTDFEGRISIQSRGGSSWFFAAAGDRKGVGDRRGPQEISRLWTLARQAFGSKIEDLDAELFGTCMTHKNLGIRKLTNGLSWISPQGFLPLGAPVVHYLQAQGIEIDTHAIERGERKARGGYRDLVAKAHSINFDNVALVKAAQDWSRDKPVISPPLKKSEFPLNQILYGPPGTGKTYNSINRAVEIIDGFAPEDRDECKARFDALRALGQIEFVTFHQSFSYEDFVEGLRPVLDEEGEGIARYEVRNGVLKEMAILAREHNQNRKGFEPSFEEVWSEFARQIKVGELAKLPGRTQRSLHELVFIGDTLEGENVLSNKESRYFSTTKEKQQKAWSELPHDQEANGGSFGRLKVGSEGSNSFNAVIFNKLTEIESKLRSGSVASRFVLIIDEINRGNISKILGELITLLEDDKRIGKPNELRVKLPVSQDIFALPPNLYVLGTMNTADKSLALLDIALRRRFSFVEMPPRAALFPDFAREALKTLNLRLEAALDREHRLGHAYFIDCADEDAFNRVFRDKIIPLLQEFFYNDWETLRAVLGESGNGRFIKELPTFSGLKARTKWRWWFETDEGEGDDFKPLQALQANFSVAKAAALVGEAVVSDEDTLSIA